MSLRLFAKQAGTELNKGVVFSLVFLVLVGFCVSKVKYEVVFLRNKLKKIDRQIEKYQDDIKVFTAEWSYLNDPKRLRNLAKKYLPDMRPTENKQIISFKTLMESDFEKEFNRNIAPVIEQNRRKVESNTKAFNSFLDEAIEKYGDYSREG